MVGGHSARLFGRWRQWRLARRVRLLAGGQLRQRLAQWRGGGEFMPAQQRRAYDLAQLARQLARQCASRMQYGHGWEAWRGLVAARHRARRALVRLGGGRRGRAWQTWLEHVHAVLARRRGTLSAVRRQLAGDTGRAWSAWLRISGETGARRRRLARYRSWLRARFCRATFERWVSRNEGDALKRTSSARMRRARLSRGMATLRGSADAKLTRLALSRAGRRSCPTPTRRRGGRVGWASARTGEARARRGARAVAVERGGGRGARRARREAAQAGGAGAARVARGVARGDGAARLGAACGAHARRRGGVAEGAVQVARGP